MSATARFCYALAIIFCLHARLWGAQSSVSSSAKSLTAAVGGNSGYLDETYRLAQSAFDSQDWPRAVTVFSLVDKFSPGYRDVRAKLAAADANFDAKVKLTIAARFYSRGVQFVAEKRWREALVAFQLAQQFRPDYYGATALQFAVPVLPAGEQSARETKPSWRSSLPGHATVVVALLSVILLAATLRPRMAGYALYCCGRFAVADRYCEWLLRKRPYDTRLLLLFARIRLRLHMQNQATVRVRCEFIDDQVSETPIDLVQVTVIDRDA